MLKPYTRGVRILTNRYGPHGNYPLGELRRISEEIAVPYITIKAIANRLHLVPIAREIYNVELRIALHENKVPRSPGPDSNTTQS